MNVSFKISQSFENRFSAYDLLFCLDCNVSLKDLHFSREIVSA